MNLKIKERTIEMRIKITNGELANIESKLEKATDMDISVSATVSYAIIKNLSAVKDALKPFLEAKDSIIKKESGGKASIRYEDDPAAFNNVASKIAEISAIEVELDIKTIDFESISDEKLPINFISAISFMIEE